MQSVANIAPIELCISENFICYVFYVKLTILNIRKYI